MNDRVAVVTGGAGAVGEGVVEALLADGWSVHLPRSGRVATHSGGPTPPRGAKLTVAEADLTDPAAVQAFFAAVNAASGRLHLLCNLVGSFAMGPTESVDPSTWNRMWSVNASAPFLCIRSAIPLLRAAGGGAIVNVAAAAAVDGPAVGMAAYLASKSALVSLTRNLAKELAPDGIRVNAVAPSVIDTPANRAAMPGADTGLWVHPREIAQVVRFLAGPEAGVVTGSVLRLTKTG